MIFLVVAIHVPMESILLGDFNCMSESIKKDDNLMAEESSRLRKKGTIDSATIDGMKIEYWRVGTGSNAVVFLHGNSSCKEVFYQQLNVLNDSEMSFIAVDLPGHGNSDNAVYPQQAYTIPGYAKLIGELLSKLGIDSYNVVGWSLGGNIAMEMAGQNLPMKGMLLMGAPPIGPGIEGVEQAFLPSSLEATGKADLSDEELNEFVQAIYGSLKPIPKALRLTAKRTHGIAREIMIGHWMSGGPGHKQTQTVANWHHPIAVVHGRKEPFVSLDYLQQTQWENLWNDKVYVLDAVGHASFVENPQKFNEILMNFIKTTA